MNDKVRQSTTLKFFKVHSWNEWNSYEVINSDQLVYSFQLCHTKLLSYFLITYQELFY